MVTRGKMVRVRCKFCRDPFVARVADRKRGWGKFCSKTCKAKEQERRTGQHAEFLNRRADDDDNIGHPMQSGLFGHGQE
jgi:hypothetical protein